jgi:hypothetical protein
MRQCLLFFFLISLLVIACKKDPIENKPPVVNAGKDTTITLINVTDSIRLSGSATDVDGTVVGYSWDQISGPKKATIHASGSPGTYVSDLVSGVYVFQLMATDDKGATGVKTISITIKAPQEYTTTLQLNQSPLDAHLQVVGSTNASDPSAPELVAAAWTVNGELSYSRGLVKFDLSSIPANARITSAKLTLYSNPTPLNGNHVDANSGSDNTLFLQRVTTNWTTSVTWQTQPSTDASSQIIIPHTSQSMLDITDLDVTGLVKDMRQYGNYGFMIRLKNEVLYTSRIFCSSKYSNTSKHPKLVVTYTN